MTQTTDPSLEGAQSSINVSNTYGMRADASVCVRLKEGWWVGKNMPDELPRGLASRPCHAGSLRAGQAWAVRVGLLELAVT